MPPLSVLIYYHPIRGRELPVTSFSRKKAKQNLRVGVFVVPYYLFSGKAQKKVISLSRYLILQKVEQEYHRSHFKSTFG